MEWINTLDELPIVPEGYYARVTVIAYTELNEVIPLNYCRAKVRGKTVYRWKYLFDRIYDYEVWYWMPLPEAPKL